MLGSFGNWPEEPKNVRFSLFLGYLMIHVTLEYVYVCQNIKQLESVVAGMTETIPFTVILLDAVLFRKDKSLLCKIIRKVNNDLKISDYKSKKEIKIFLGYNMIAGYFLRIAVPLVFSASIMYFVKPFFTGFTTIGENNTLIYNLPYRVHLFYDVTDLRVYSLIYVFQMPLVFIGTFGYSGVYCFLITITLHVCGRLSILASRIKNLRCDSREYREPIRILINKHAELIRLARDVEDAFNFILLGQLFAATFLICFLGYNVLANTSEGRVMELAKFFIYGFSVVVLLFICCYIGDCLTRESIKVQDAFFQCLWYELQVEASKSFVICIIQSQKTLALTAGKLYVFSLPTFADVIKSSAAYLSVLRTFL